MINERLRFCRVHTVWDRHDFGASVCVVDECLGRLRRLKQPSQYFPWAGRQAALPGFDYNRQGMIDKKRDRHGIDDPRQNNIAF